MEETKYCKECKQNKPSAAFRKITYRNGNPGMRTLCRKCENQKSKEYRKSNKNKIKPKLDNKYCPRCKTIKTPVDFALDSTTKDGYCWQCKNCSKQKSLKYREFIKSLDKPPITHKICTKCGQTLLISQFAPHKEIKDGFSNWCKMCHREYNKIRTLKLKKSDKIKPVKKRCSSCKTYKTPEEYCKNNLKIDGINSLCKECAKKKQKIYIPRIIQRTRERLKTDANFRLVHNLRGRMRSALKTHSKRASTIKLLGCTGEECMKYLEALFWPGMTQENMGEQGWVIDHVVPIDAFDKTDPNWQFEAFHYTNLQPLWYADNNSKKARLDWTPQESKHELPERLKTATSSDKSDSKE